MTTTNPPMCVLRPGDKVLVVLDSSTPDETVRESAKGLHDAFPGVEFVVMNGVDTFAVYAPEAQDVRHATRGTAG